MKRSYNDAFVEETRHSLTAGIMEYFMGNNGATMSSIIKKKYGTPLVDMKRWLAGQLYRINNPNFGAMPKDPDGPAGACTVAGIAFSTDIPFYEKESRKDAQGRELLPPSKDKIAVGIHSVMAARYGREIANKATASLIENGRFSSFATKTSTPETEPYVRQYNPNSRDEHLTTAALAFAGAHIDKLASEHPGEREIKMVKNAYQELRQFYLDYLTTHFYGTPSTTSAMFRLTKIMKLRAQWDEGGKYYNQRKDKEFFTLETVRSIFHRVCPFHTYDGSPDSGGDGVVFNKLADLLRLVDGPEIETYAATTMNGSSIMVDVPSLSINQTANSGPPFGASTNDQTIISLLYMVTKDVKFSIEDDIHMDTVITMARNCIGKVKSEVYENAKMQEGARMIFSCSPIMSIFARQFSILISKAIPKFRDDLIYSLAYFAPYKGGMHEYLTVGIQETLDRVGKNKRPVVFTYADNFYIFSGPNVKSILVYSVDVKKMESNHRHEHARVIYQVVFEQVFGCVFDGAGGIVSCRTMLTRIATLAFRLLGEAPFDMLVQMGETTHVRPGMGSGVPNTFLTNHLFGLCLAFVIEQRCDVKQIHALGKEGNYKALNDLFNAVTVPLGYEVEVDNISPLSGLSFAKTIESGFPNVWQISMLGFDAVFSSSYQRWLAVPTRETFVKILGYTKKPGPRRKKGQKGDPPLPDAVPDNDNSVLQTFILLMKACMVGDMGACVLPAEAILVHAVKTACCTAIKLGEAHVAPKIDTIIGQLYSGAIEEALKTSSPLKEFAAGEPLESGMLAVASGLNHGVDVYLTLATGLNDIEPFFTTMAWSMDQTPKEILSMMSPTTVLEVARLYPESVPAKVKAAAEVEVELQHDVLSGLKRALRESRAKIEALTKEHQAYTSLSHALTTAFGREMEQTTSTKKTQKKR